MASPLRSAATVRREVEAALAARIPAALTPARSLIRPVSPTGVAAVDRLLAGGLPQAAISELSGPESSGRTSLALSYVARITAQGGVAAWVDAGDALHAETAAAAGVDLSRLLWVRCPARPGKPGKAVRPGFTLPQKYFRPAPGIEGLHGGGFGPHPRSEARGLAAEVGGFLLPGGPPPSGASPDTASPDTAYPDTAIPDTARLVAAPAGSPGGGRPRPWGRIEQALNAADLLLEGGGFSAVVLDLAGVAAASLARLEPSLWFRYRAAAERTRTSLLLLSQHPSAGSARQLLLRFRPGTPGGGESTVFTGIEHTLEAEGRRFAGPGSGLPLRRPAQRETAAGWRTQAAWAGAR